MRKSIVLAAIAVFALAMLVPVTAIASTEAAPFTVELIAGQNIDAGSVFAWNDAGTLYVKFKTTGNWLLAETHVDVAATVPGIPQKNGNPIPGKFAYKTTHNPFVTEYTYSIPGTWTTGTYVFIAAHASVVMIDGSGNVVQQETGWGGCKIAPVRFPGNNWAICFYYPVS